MHPQSLFPPQHLLRYFILLPQSKALIIQTIVKQSSLLWKDPLYVPNAKDEIIHSFITVKQDYMITKDGKYKVHDRESQTHHQMHQEQCQRIYQLVPLPKSDSLCTPSRSHILSGAKRNSMEEKEGSFVSTEKISNSAGVKSLKTEKSRVFQPDFLSVLKAFEVFFLLMKYYIVLQAPFLINLCLLILQLLSGNSKFSHVHLLLNPL